MAQARTTSLDGTHGTWCILSWQLPLHWGLLPQELHSFSGCLPPAQGPHISQTPRADEMSSRLHWKEPQCTRFTKSLVLSKRAWLVTERPWRTIAGFKMHGHTRSCSPKNSVRHGMPFLVCFKLALSSYKYLGVISKE